jgi:formate hydrogenlyase subunit 3/multisubunit Na+/H+ antiporter MnhD subunit
MSTYRVIGYFLVVVAIWGFASNLLFGDHKNEYGEWVQEDYSSSIFFLILGVVFVFIGLYREKKQERK